MELTSSQIGQSSISHSEGRDRLILFHQRPDEEHAIFAFFVGMMLLPLVWLVFLEVLAESSYPIEQTIVAMRLGLGATDFLKPLS